MAGTNTLIIPNPWGLPVVIPGDTTLNWNDKLWNWLRYGDLYPPPPVPIIAAPQTQEQMVTGGSWTPDIATQQTMSDYQAALQKFYGALDTTVNPPDTGGGSIWLYVGIAVAAILVLRR